MTINTQLIVLGAGQPTSYLNPLNSSLLPTKRNSLDWIRIATQKQVTSSNYVAGYQMEEAAPQVHGFAISYNPAWEDSGSIASMLCVQRIEDHQSLVCYADVVFRETIVKQLIGDTRDIVLAIDTEWRDRYVRRTKQDIAAAEKVLIRDGVAVEIGRAIDLAESSAEFVGLVKFSPAAQREIHRLVDADVRLREKGSLIELITCLLKHESLSSGYHDAIGNWAELNAPQDLAHFIFGTKAETLERLKPVLQSMYVEDQVSFTTNEWATGSDEILNSIQQEFSGESVIVRSSAQAEDSWATANAGVFASILNVDSANPTALQNSIEEVLESYGTVNGADQIFVQKMLSDAIASGVIFTRTLSHGAPYFAINYDPTPGCTDSVTGGGTDLKMLFVHHDAKSLPHDVPSWMDDLLTGIREVVERVGYDSLDLEFAVTPEGKICLLQLRPIAVDHSDWTIDDGMLRKELDNAVARFLSLQAPSRNLRGNRAVFGVMPDWNPAEIVGIRPALLSISLYRYLICDEIWAQQRAEYGYRDVRPQPLIVSFAGHPYVNTRASFSSFLPHDLSDELADKLVDHYQDRLIENPALHDKVEFDIAFTCLSLDFYDRAENDLRPNGFNDEEIEILRRNLVEITRHGMDRYTSDLNQIKTLSSRYDAIMEGDGDPLERACVLLDDCRLFGTLAFSHLARGAFVAMAMLRSAVHQGLIDETTLDAYLLSINTVAKDFIRDGAAVAEDKGRWDEFINRYGHLRPATYDILSPTYRENEQAFLENSIFGSGPDTTGLHDNKSFEWPIAKWNEIQAGFARLGLEIERDSFDRFTRSVIEGREYAKFMFTRNISQALTDLVRYGESIGVDRSILAEVPVSCFFSIRSGESHGDPAAFLKRTAALYEDRRKIVKNAELPPLIHDPLQFSTFYHPSSEPNFVTSKSVTAEVKLLTDGKIEEIPTLRGKIVVIPQADPGYDWLFGCGISGLITMYGGANSHIAIRSAEFGLPAAIGVGEVIFEQLRHTRAVLLDCSKRKIDFLG